MESVTTIRFRKAFAQLPKEIQGKARKAYKLWKQNHYYPALHFKQITDDPPVFSVRIGLSYRALGVKKEDTIIWFGLVLMKIIIILFLNFSRISTIPKINLTTSVVRLSWKNRE